MAWAYLVGGAVLAIGIAVVVLRGRWAETRGWDRLLLFAPFFYGAPLAAFGSEHFTTTREIAAIVPSWIPWHLFWAYFVGACFIAAGLSLATGVWARLAASLVALTFFLFVVLMDIPAWAQHPHDRIGLALVLRELAFSGGALALAASFAARARARGSRAAATVARYFLAIPVLVYSVEQFLHGDHVPGVPLELATPRWIFGHAVWTYLVAAVFAVAGVLLLAGKKPRAAAVGAGVAVLFAVLVVYVPLAAAGHAGLLGFNYLGDTLMFGGAVLLLAGAMPSATARRESPRPSQPAAVSG